MLTLNFEGTHVLVTGGKQGIGRAVVEMFLAGGANVSYCSRTSTGEEFSSFLASTFPQGNAPVASGAAVDVSKPDEIQNWVKSAVEMFGRIDTVVSNVSALGINANDLSTWHESFATDILALVTLCSSTEPHLKSTASSSSKSSPSIILISSIAAINSSLGGPSPYGPLKAAQTRQMMALAKELGPSGVRVNVISPGPIDSPAMAATVQNQEGGEKLVEGMKMQIPLGRFGAMKDVANAVGFLASELAGWITGATLIVDGGLSRHC